MKAKQRRLSLTCLQCGNTDYPITNNRWISCPHCEYREKAKFIPLKAIEEQLKTASPDVKELRSYAQIDVTEEDIKKAASKRDSGITSKLATWCPVAQALKRTGYKNVCVNEHVISANDTAYPAPPEVKKAVDDFDGGKDIEPFSFYIEETLIVL